jgi:hypothetical protein
MTGTTMRSVLIFCILLLMSAQAHAQGDSRNINISIREWLNDVEVLRSEVLKPLREQFKTADCPVHMDDYFREYLLSLQKIRAKIASISYLVFREVFLITAQDLAPVDHLIPCPGEINKWTLFESHIQNKLEFTGNIFAILDITGSL